MRTDPLAPFRLTFQRKLLLAFAAVLLPVVGVMGVDLLEDARATRHTLLEAQSLTAHAVAVQVAESFEAAIDLGWALANDPLVRTLEPELVDAHLLRLTGHHTRFSSVGVYDAQGHNRGWGDPSAPAEPRLWIGDRPFFRKVMATNQPVISEVVQLRRPERTGLIVAVPIRDARGQPVGVVDIVLETHLLAQRYLSARRDSGQDILLVDPSGRLAFHTHVPALGFEDGLAFASLPALRQALAGHTVQVEDATSPLDHEALLGAFVPLPHYPWAVGVMAPRELALAPLTARLYLKLAALLGIAMVSALLCVVLAQRQTRPVRQLVSLAQALGRGHLTHRVHLRTGDEMEDLGAALHQMADHIAQRQAEVDALRAEAEGHARQLAAIIASVPDAILLASPDGRLVDANPAGLALLGISARAQLTTPLSQHLQRSALRHPDGRALAPEELPLWRALQGETFTDLELSMRALTGEERHVSVNGAPVRDATGRIILGEVVLHDITERKRVERERLRLLEHERALARIGQALVREVTLERLTDVAAEQAEQALGAEAVGLWLARPDTGRCVRMASRGLGAREDEGLADFPVSALPSGPRSAPGEAFALSEPLDARGTDSPLHALARREGFTRGVLIPLHSRGRLEGLLACFGREPGELSARELEFHTTVGRLVAVAIEKARLFQEVREALRLREEFMSAAAHELKTPVTTLQTWADILTWKEGGTERQRKGLEAISRGARRLGRLVEHLFTALRLAPGMAKLERDRVDLRALLSEHVCTLSRTTDNPIHLEAAEAPIIDADRQRMGEVMAHLLENAIRYSPPTCPIEVRLGCAGNQAVVSIRDQGPGIPPERQPHVFEPLYEPLPSGVPGYVGTAGLGLHLSSRIIEAHGGRIWLESRPGEGTTFCFSLPLDEMETARHANA